MHRIAGIGSCLGVHEIAVYSSVYAAFRELKVPLIGVGIKSRESTRNIKGVP